MIVNSHRTPPRVWRMATVYFRRTARYYNIIFVGIPILCAGSATNFPPDVHTKTLSREIENPCRAEIPEVRELNSRVYVCVICNRARRVNPLNNRVPAAVVFLEKQLGYL